EFDICYLIDDTLIVVECKNVPIYSRRDRTDITVFKRLNYLAKLHQTVDKYLNELKVKQTLEYEGIKYSRVACTLLIPSSMPLTGTMDSFLLRCNLEYHGKHLDTEFIDARWKYIEKTLEVNPRIYERIHPQYLSNINDNKIEVFRRLGKKKT
ncbi:MAG: hypothetical protein ACFFD2_24265, partial [Promethearchaeota archaeon]